MILKRGPVSKSSSKIISVLWLHATYSYINVFNQNTTQQIWCQVVFQCRKTLHKQKVAGMKDLTGATSRFIWRYPWSIPDRILYLQWSVRASRQIWMLFFLILKGLCFRGEISAGSKGIKWKLNYKCTWGKREFGLVQDPLRACKAHWDTVDHFEPYTLTFTSCSCFMG